MIPGVMIDKSDADILEGLRWYILEASPGKRYAAASFEGKTVYMHRMIMNPPKGMVVDHIDGDGLNNTRSNLRVCTHQQNISNRGGLQRNNTSGYTGVCRRRNGRWEGKVKFMGKVYRCGVHDSPEDAAAARDKKAAELHGEFAFLNFPNS